ncbi:GNAT family N-acetyltransferase [Propionimicrobium sp. PCR01-08-3]|uniref:GNAT family N-acetyltransferase n=1 Tax=Propionimicrobium sp. PCR01-08-3 TaxID=3052086 RepID=UPI00255C4913|nr:GNAT family N-acetyltransferase [Propionimicrobium sp. PCR01-08-3]WIY82051.1 GNAT family N-acetyltransferase [Propionimicrobium sp. PCR01-08-3]
MELSDGVIKLIPVNPAQAQELASGRSPLPAVPDYPHADTAAAARIFRDSLGIDNWVPGFGIYLIVRAGDGLVVGDAGFHTPPDLRGSAEIGYGLAPSARGQGLASRAVRLLTAWGFAQPGLSSVVGETDAGNLASIQVLEACGFVRIADRGDRVRYLLQRRPT